MTNNTKIILTLLLSLVANATAAGAKHPNADCRHWPTHDEYWGNSETFEKEEIRGQEYVNKQ